MSCPRLPKHAKADPTLTYLHVPVAVEIREMLNQMVRAENSKQTTVLARVIREAFERWVAPEIEVEAEGQPVEYDWAATS